MATTRSADFEGDLGAPARARLFAVEALGRTHDSEALSDAATIVSELVTNAVRAGAGHIVVSVETDPGSDIVRFAVSDDVDGWPTVRPAATSDTTGRGLPIVSALATEWGVVPTDDGGSGKSVWATLPVIR